MLVTLVVQVVEEQHHFHQVRIKKDVVTHLRQIHLKVILEELVMVVQDQVVEQLQLEEVDKVQHLPQRQQEVLEHLI
tara:strand:+ start:272 stop:502 length:231 start_codon:yes stop_codon:yes gene_type:complete